MFSAVAFWQQQVTAATATQSIIYGLMLLGGNSAAYSTATNSSTWTTSTPGLSSNWYGIGYSEPQKLFVACSETGPTRRTSNMINFTASATVTPSGGGMRAVKWINELNLWIGAGITTTGGNLSIRTSTDGNNWTNQSTPALAGFLEDVIWSGATAVSMSQTSRVITSTNGTTWTSRTAATGQWHGGAYSPSLNRFVIGGINGYIGVSDNGGVTWSVVARTGGWRYFAWSPKLNLFVGTRTGSNPAYSSDGLSWTASTAGTLNWWNVIWNAEQEIFIATVISSQTRPTWRSVDGINWTQQTTVLASGSWIGIGYRKQIL
jgi:hypothetical protein